MFGNSAPYFCVKLIFKSISCTSIKSNRSLLELSLTESFEDVVKKVITDASKTINDIKSVYIQVTFDMNIIAEYRVITKWCFGIMN